MIKRCNRWVTGCIRLDLFERAARRVAGCLAAAHVARRTVRPMCARYMTRLRRRRWPNCRNRMCCRVGNGAVKAATGWHAERLIVAGEDGRAAACQFLWRQLSRYLPVRGLCAWAGRGLDGRCGRRRVGGSGESCARGCVFAKIDRRARDLAEAWSCARNYGDAAGVSAPGRFSSRTPQ